MARNKKSYKTFWIIFIIFILYILVKACADDESTITKFADNNSKTFRIIASQENEALEYIIKDYAKSKNYDVTIEYAGTLDIIDKLNSKEEYDAVWLSNSIWGYMIDSSVKLINSKCTSINPVIFAIKESKAKQLGFINKEIYTRDIVNAISSGNLKFAMSNPTSTNSGASAYLGILSTLAGNPEVLTEANFKDENLKNSLKALFTGLERSSGSEDFLEELLFKENYEAVVTYESSIINMNKKFLEQGKETLYAVYPVDGVSISDSPFAYIDNKNAAKKDIFTDIQTYLLSNEGQKKLQNEGRRTWYGGVSENTDKNIFNPNWGIDTTKYISPTKYPNTKVIKLALNLYQTELRKPVHVVFCLDYSGSMYGEGERELKNAMEYILTDKAANDFIQFSEKDKIDVIPFATSVDEVWSVNNGIQTIDLLNKIKSYEPYGSTALYPSAVKALDLLKLEDKNRYNLSIVLMTDGEGNVGRFSELQEKYKMVKIPIYSIMFGSANEEQLKSIANLTNGKVFDGKKDLVRAFKEVRGYN